MAGRGWAWTAYDWDEGRLFNYIGDAQNTFPVWNATPLVALDVYEHAYFLDYQTDRAAYIEAFLRNLDWGVVNGWVESYSNPGRVGREGDARRPGRVPPRLDAVRLLGAAARPRRGHPRRRGAGTSARRTSSASTGARSASRSRCSTSQRASPPPRSGSGPAVRSSACWPRARGDGRPRAARLPSLPEGREDGCDRGRRDPRARAARRVHLHRGVARSSSSRRATRRSRRS